MEETEDLLDPANEPAVEYEDTSSKDDRIIRPFNPNEIEIEIPPFSVSFLVDKLTYNEINLNTEFQRENNLWKPEQQSKLIESILLGLPLPAFYFDTSKEQWDIVDGLQRCCSIDNFCVKKTLRLVGLEFLGYKDGEPFLEGKSFDELDNTLKRSILTRPITVNLIKKADRKVRFILFKRLNTGGLELKPAEIRNAVYQGKASRIVKELAQSDSFKTATTSQIPTNRMEDRDFVSRFVSFYLTDYTQYEPGLDDFLNSNMEKLESLNDEEENAFKQDFENAMNLAINIFGTEAFRKKKAQDLRRKPINKAYFEVIATSLAKLNEQQRKSILDKKELFEKNLYELMSQDRYNRSLSGGTGTKSSVNIRFSWFKQVLDYTLQNKKIRITDDYKIEGVEL